MRCREFVIAVVAVTCAAVSSLRAQGGSGHVGIGPRPPAHASTTVSSRPPPPGAVVLPIRQAGH
jgi:hypothetical protein